MPHNYKPPLLINLVWNKADESSVKPIIEDLRTSLSRSKNKPFSRSLNLPLFCYSSNDPKVPPRNIPATFAQNNVTLIFTSLNTVGNPEWKTYVESINNNNNKIVPIAIDDKGILHTGNLSGVNCLRGYDFPSAYGKYYARLMLCHEIFRFGLNHISEQNGVGKNSSVSIFISHGKLDRHGPAYAKAIKRIIDDTNLNHFFDATEISPGFNFEEEIEAHIKKSTLIAIETDNYSTRYWCQREVLSAKKNNRPIIVVNCLESFEDRIFPAASNVPCIHITPESDPSDTDILRILSASLVETIRHAYTIELLSFYKIKGWIPSTCYISSRPPEIRQVLQVKNNGASEICYPEPPIYSVESDWINILNIKAFTPLWMPHEEEIFFGQNIGISISEVVGDDYSNFNQFPDNIVKFSQDLSRHLLSRSATLVYGGDLRQDGFTQFILDEATILKQRLPRDIQAVENHLAWPLYISEPEILAWRAKYSGVMKTVEHKIPLDIVDQVDKDVFLPPKSIAQRYYWSRCLTEMRTHSIKSCSIRICAGGRLYDYKGKMPGVLEEILISIEKNKPIYLLGGFGGVVAEVAETLHSGKITEPLTEEWQNNYCHDYKGLQRFASSHGHEANYDEVRDKLEGIKLSTLSARAGLLEEDYKRLMSSPFIDECVHLILKGIKNIVRDQKI